MFDYKLLLTTLGSQAVTVLFPLSTDVTSSTHQPHLTSEIKRRRVLKKMTYIIHSFVVWLRAGWTHVFIEQN